MGQFGDCSVQVGLSGIVRFGPKLRSLMTEISWNLLAQIIFLPAPDFFVNLNYPKLPKYKAAQIARPRRFIISTPSPLTSILTLTLT